MGYDNHSFFVVGPRRILKILSVGHVTSISGQDCIKRGNMGCNLNVEGHMGRSFKDKIEGPRMLLGRRG